MRTDPVNTVRIFRTTPPSARWGRGLAGVPLIVPDADNVVSGVSAGGLAALRRALVWERFARVPRAKMRQVELMLKWIRAQTACGSQLLQYRA